MPGLWQCNAQTCHVHDRLIFKTPADLKKKIRYVAYELSFAFGV